MVQEGGRVRERDSGGTEVKSVSQHAIGKQRRFFAFSSAFSVSFVSFSLFAFGEQQINSLHSQPERISDPESVRKTMLMIYEIAIFKEYAKISQAIFLIL